MTQWINVSDVERIAGVSAVDFSDGQIQSMISLAQREINSKLITKVDREPINYIDAYRSNKIDGVNTTFFMRNWRTPNQIIFRGVNVMAPTLGGLFQRTDMPNIPDYGKTMYLADTNFDNEVTISDIRVIQYDPNNQTEIDLIPTSIDINNCSFVLPTAPTNVQLFVSYSYTPVDPYQPDYFVQLCTAYLAGSYLFIGTDGFEYKFGNVSIKPGIAGGKGKQLYNKAQELLHQIIVNSNGGSSFSDMAIQI